MDGVASSVEPNEAVLKMAKDFAQKPMDSVSRIKGLLSCCLTGVVACLEWENQVLMQTVSRFDLQEKLREYTESYH